MCKSLLWCVHLVLLQEKFDTVFAQHRYAWHCGYPIDLWQGMTKTDCVTLSGPHRFGRTDTVKFHCPVVTDTHEWAEFWPRQQILQIWSKRQECAPIFMNWWNFGFWKSGLREACVPPCGASIRHVACHVLRTGGWNFDLGSKIWKCGGQALVDCQHTHTKHIAGQSARQACVPPCG